MLKRLPARNRFEVTRKCYLEYYSRIGTKSTDLRDKKLAGSGQFREGNQQWQKRAKKDYIERQYENDSDEKRRRYVELFNSDPAYTPTPPLPTPKPLDNIDAYFTGLGDGSREYLGLKTGLKELDTLISGLQKFVLFAGAGGTGKSTLAMQLAAGVIEHEQCPVIYYSFEMDKFDAYTMLAQLAASKINEQLSKSDILLHGNDPQRPDIITKIAKAKLKMSEYSNLLYVLGHDDAGDLANMEIQIKDIMAKHSSDKALVVIDSVQDVLIPGLSGTESEAATAAAITAIQQSTGATILGISQKSKSGWTNNGYGSVLGSISWVHKPTTVVEFIGIREAIASLPKKDQSIFYKLSNNNNMPQPVIGRVIKGRNTGYGQIALKFYGKHGYFEAGRVKDYDTEPSIYRALHFPEESRYEQVLKAAQS